MQRHWRLISLDDSVKGLKGQKGPGGQKGQRRRRACSYDRASRSTFFFVLSVPLVLFVLSVPHTAQTLQSRANDIRAAMDAREFTRAETLARELRSNDQSAFTRNDYDYLLARLLERRGAKSEASALYLGMLERNPIVAQYALWHLSL